MDIGEIRKSVSLYGFANLEYGILQGYEIIASN